MLPRRLPAIPDSRDRVSPDDLNVAPALLGMPLARPGKRLLAVAIDVAIVALLSNHGNVWLVVGCGLVALAFLREPAEGRPPPRRWPLFLAAAALIGIGFQQGFTHRGDDAEEVAAHAARQAASAPGAAFVIDGIASAVPGLTPLQIAEAKIAVLQAQLAEAREPKAFNLREQIRTWADEVGLGLGWAIVYFSLLPVWWKGQTVGKRLLGLRIVELTGKPMTALRAFKRYGGYAAGMATGMVGFLQVLWDPNRQAIQDKTAHTVVIDLRRKLVDPPMPSPAEPEDPR